MEKYKKIPTTTKMNTREIKVQAMLNEILNLLNKSMNFFSLPIYIRNLHCIHTDIALHPDTDKKSPKHTHTQSTNIEQTNTIELYACFTSLNE